eukprot:2798388-Amphidinium_carterae.1
MFQSNFDLYGGTQKFTLPNPIAIPQPIRFLSSSRCPIRRIPENKVGAAGKFGTWDEFRFRAEIWIDASLPAWPAFRFAIKSCLAATSKSEMRCTGK